jgi:hypothetical protein
MPCPIAVAAAPSVTCHDVLVSDGNPKIPRSIIYFFQGQKLQIMRFITPDIQSPA